MMRTALLAFALLATFLSSGCTTAILSPIIISEYQEYKRHSLLVQPPLPALPMQPAAAPSAAPAVVVDRFVVAAGRERRYFDEIWLLPLLPWTDRNYPLLAAEPSPIASDTVWLPLDAIVPPDDRSGPDYESWRGNFIWRMGEKLAAAPPPPGAEHTVRERLSTDCAGAVEGRVVQSLRAAMPGVDVEPVWERAPMKLVWRFRDGFDYYEFARGISERQAMSGTGEAVRIGLDPREDIRLVPEFGDPGLRAGDVRIEGIVQAAQLEKRRHLWLVGLPGSNYLSLLGVPQSRSRYALELVLTARSARGDVLARRTVAVRTRRGTASLWYGYGKMRDRLAAEFDAAVTAELDSFAQELAARMHGTP